MGDAMREHVGLAGAGAGDDEQRRRAVRLAGAMLDREPLGVVQVARGGARIGVSMGGGNRVCGLFARAGDGGAS